MPLINELWQDILAEEFLLRPRLSRIYYKHRFFDYPLKPFNALVGLGPIESLLVGLSYLHAQFIKNHDEKTFEDWVTNRFGHRLYRIFFKTYTERFGESLAMRSQPIGRLSGSRTFLERRSSQRNTQSHRT